VALDLVARCSNELFARQLTSRNYEVILALIHTKLGSLSWSRFVQSSVIFGSAPWRWNRIGGTAKYFGHYLTNFVAGHAAGKGDRYAAGEEKWR